jgi:hypothetical protein
MQVHPELTTALLAEHERDLRTRAAQRRMLPGRDRSPRSGTRLVLAVFGATRVSR